MGQCLPFSASSSVLAFASPPKTVRSFYNSQTDVVEKEEEEDENKQQQHNNMEVPPPPPPPPPNQTNATIEKHSKGGEVVVSETRKYLILKCLGEGGFATCYLLTPIHPPPPPSTKTKQNQNEDKEEEEEKEKEAPTKLFTCSSSSNLLSPEAIHKYEQETKLNKRRRRRRESNREFFFVGKKLKHHAKRSSAISEFAINKYIATFGRCEQIVCMHHLVLSTQKTFSSSSFASSSSSSSSSTYSKKIINLLKTRHDPSDGGGGSGEEEEAEEGEITFSPFVNRDWLFMEYCSGGTLDAWLDRNGPIRDERIVHVIMHDLLQALYFLHKTAKVIHRDVNPCNILFVSPPPTSLSTTTPPGLPNFRIKLADFGFSIVEPTHMAQALQHNAAETAQDSDNAPPITKEAKEEEDMITGTGCIVGRLAYASIEMVRGDARCSFPTDIWSAGVTLYVMLFGKEPFEYTKDPLGDDSFGSYYSCSLIGDNDGGNGGGGLSCHHSHHHHNTTKEKITRQILDKIKYCEPNPQSNEEIESVSHNIQMVMWDAIRPQPRISIEQFLAFFAPPTTLHLSETT